MALGNPTKTITTPLGNEITIRPASKGRVLAALDRLAAKGFKAEDLGDSEKQPDGTMKVVRAGDPRAALHFSAELAKEVVVGARVRETEGGELKTLSKTDLAAALSDMDEEILFAVTEAQKWQSEKAKVYEDDEKNS